MSSGRSPVGQITRGTTGTNRLRRVDRWIARHPALRRAADPLVVDLGYGASGVTALELHARLARARPDVEVLGLEIDPAASRARARSSPRCAPGATSFAPDARVSFALGGFEVPIARGRRPAVIRAMNVLRQYDEAEVARRLGDAWPRGSRRAGCSSRARATSSAASRRGSRSATDAAPRTLTISLRLAGLEHPSIAAERLPKALIHRNVPGERVHALLAALDDEWERAARSVAVRPGAAVERALAALRAAGWPVQERSRWRLGELTVPWSAVAPAADGDGVSLRSAARRRALRRCVMPVAVSRSTASGRSAAMRF